MSARVVIIPDKFKGTLTAPEAAASIAKGWRRVRPKDRLELIPMSDGGDGFGETLSLQENGERRRVKTTNAAGEAIWAPWWWLPKSRTAVIETAQVVGLAQLPTGKYHPFELDTYGLGVLIEKILAANPRSCLIGLGGSATNDGGFGMARALGWRFYNREGKEIEAWTDLMWLHRLTSPTRQRRLPRVVVAVDVQNRLNGRSGASRVYGPQKGLQEEDMPQAEACLKALARGFHMVTDRNEAKRPGAGAAGGLGFACFAFLDGTSQSGFDVFATCARLEKRLERADLVITGEGSIDQSSFMGKGVGRVVQWCEQLKIPCLGLGGVVQRRCAGARKFEAVHSIVGNPLKYVDEADAMGRPKQCLTELTQFAAERWGV